MLTEHKIHSLKADSFKEQNLSNIMKRIVQKLECASVSAFALISKQFNNELKDYWMHFSWEHIYSTFTRCIRDFFSYSTRLRFTFALYSLWQFVYVDPVKLCEMIIGLRVRKFGSVFVGYRLIENCCWNILFGLM